MTDTSRAVGFRDLSSWRALVLMMIALTSCSACTTGSPTAGDSWSRDYVSTYERVFEAAVAALEEIDFYLDDEDWEKGRIRARSSARRAGPDATLFVDVRQKSDRIRVDVMAQSSSLEDGRAPAEVSGLVRDFFSGLDSRLEGRFD